MSLTYSLAEDIIGAAMLLAANQKVEIAAVVLDRSGRVLASQRCDSTGFVNLSVAERKAMASVNFGAPTASVLDMVRTDAMLLTSVMAEPRLCLLPGGVPIKVEGALAGALGVAGGHYSQDQVIADQALVQSGLAPRAPPVRPSSPREGSGRAGYDFKDFSVVVSGALGGIGAHACELFAKAGARVLGVDRQPDEGGRRGKALTDMGLDVGFAVLDVADPAQVEAFGVHALKTLGRVDVLVNNAGVLSFSPLLMTDAREWDRVQDVNCRSVFLMMKALAPLMAGKGVILNMSSSAALAPTANSAAYSVAKMGVVTLTKIAALEFGPGIRVNAICPGPLDTQMPRNYLRGHPMESAIMDSMIARTVVKRLGRPEEIADLVLFLASDQAEFITGAVISADGGFMN